MTFNCPKCNKPFRDNCDLRRHVNKKFSCTREQVQKVSTIPQQPQTIPTEQITYKKKNIPKALREQVWIKYNDNTLKMKCHVQWCNNTIDVFNFHVGHNIPESKGGSTTLENLRPICSRCNLSMSNDYSIDEWNELGEPQGSSWCCFSIKQ
jgi:5-methylcytosine-specific restriction endonuclease McrA